MKKLSLIILTVICSYILITGVADVLPNYARYNEKRILQVVVLAFVNILVLLSTPQRLALANIFSSFSANTRLLLLLFFLIGILSSLVHSHPLYSLLEVSIFFLLLVTALNIAIARNVLGTTFNTTVTLFVASFSLMYMVIFLAGYSATIFGGAPLVPYEFFGNFSTIRFFNQVQGWLLPIIPLLLYLRDTKDHKLLHWTITVVATTWWLMLFVSGGRGVLLGIVTALILTRLLWRNLQARELIRFHTKAALTGGVLFIIFFSIIPHYQEAHIEVERVSNNQTIARVTSQSRLYLWRHAFTLGLEEPVLGAGPLALACQTGNKLKGAHPHNALMQLVSEWGWLAAIIVIVIFLRGVMTWVKLSYLSSINTASDIIYPALFISLCSAAIYGMFSGVIVMPLSQTLMALIIGWMIGVWYSAQQYENEKSKKPLTEIFITVATLLSIYAMLYAIVPEIPYIEQEQKSYTLSKLLPRIWQQGLICLE